MKLIRITMFIAMFFFVFTITFADKSSDLEIKESIDLCVYPVDKGVLQPAEMNDDPYDLPQNTPENHKKLWNLVRSLLPDNLLKQHIVQFKVSTDGIDNSLASVTAVNDENNNDFEFDVDLVDSLDDNGNFRKLKDLQTSILHESGHLLTLNDSQVTLIDEKDKNDKTYYTYEGQSLPDSYLNQFVEKFWDKAKLAVSVKNSKVTDQEKKDEAVADFYDKNPDQFLTEYAATEPEEDIAETWCLFILQPKPAGKTVAEQKLLFFYNYPELVKMRDSIRKAAGM